MNEYNGYNYNYRPPEKKSLLNTPSVTVPKGYNPYRDDLSVVEEVITEYPNALQGTEPLPGENDIAHTDRLISEWRFLRGESFRKLKKSALWTSLIVLMYLGIYYSLSIAASMLLSVIPSASDLISDLLGVMLYVFLFPAVIITANIGHKHKAYTFFAKPQVSSGFIAKWCVIALGLTYLVSFVFQFIFSVLESLGLYINDLSSPVPNDAAGLIFYFITVAILAPIFEEILFRGVFLTHNMKFGCTFAAVVTGVLFGLIHQNHSQMFYAAVLGIVFAYMDIKAGSIIPSLIAHASVNTFSFIITLLLHFTNYNETLADPSLKLDGPAVVIMLIGLLDYVVYALILVALVLLITEAVKNRSSLTLPAGDSGLTASEKATTFFLSPTMLIVLIILAICIAVVSFVPISEIARYAN